jgi:hypothetical protein
MFAFGIALVTITLWRERAMFRKALLIIVLLAIGTHFITRTDQAGLLLYTSVVHLTPAHLKSAPGFENYIAPLQQRMLARWQKFPAFGRVPDRKEIAAQVNAYLRDHRDKGTPGRDQDVNSFCKKLAYETCLHALPKLPMLAYYKFRNSAAEATSTGFEDYWLIKRQMAAFTDDVDMTASLSKWLTGRELKTQEEIEQWVREHYVAARVEWFNKFHTAWHQRIFKWRLPDWNFQPKPGSSARLFGVPFFFLIALVGMIAAAFRRDSLQPMRILWTLNLLGLFFIIMLTANVKSRFRYVFEPFWWLYILLLFDALAFLACCLFRRHPGRNREAA